MLRVQAGIRRLDEMEATFVSTIQAIIKDASSGHCESSAVISWALELLRHSRYRNADDKKNEWVMSCQHGQAVWPSIYETYACAENGYLSLLWHPGMLRWRDEVYPFVKSYTSTTWRSIALEFSRSVRDYQNLIAQRHLTWAMTAAETFLEVHWFLEPGEHFRPSNVGPHQALWNLSSTYLADACPHGRDEMLNYPEDSRLFVLRHDANFRNYMERDQLAILAGNSTDEKRLFTLSCIYGNSKPIVLSKNSCLFCSLNVCREIGSMILIL